MGPVLLGQRLRPSASGLRHKEWSPASPAATAASKPAQPYRPPGAAAPPDAPVSVPALAAHRHPGRLLRTAAQCRPSHRLRARKAAAPEPDAARALDARIFALLLPAMLTVLLEPSMAIIDAGKPLQRVRMNHPVQYVLACAEAATVLQ